MKNVLLPISWTLLPLLPLLACTGHARNSSQSEQSKDTQSKDDGPLANFAPNFDRRSAAMTLTDINSVQRSVFTAGRYFSQPVPHIVQRAVAADEQPSRCPDLATWESHAQMFDYELHTWSPNDVLSGQLQAAPEVQAAVAQALAADREDVALHLVGLAALKEEGGVWVGPQTCPPQVRGQPVAIDQVVNMKGLTIATNVRARDVGGISVYLTTGLMAAPPMHPWIRLVAEAAADNTCRLLADDRQMWPVRYFAGNAFLSRHLAGVFHVIPYRTLESLGMFPQGIRQGAEDALD